MSREKPTTIYRRDYLPPDYRIETVELHFDLNEERTRVRAKLAIRRSARLQGDLPPLVLDGEELVLLGVWLDGRELAKSEYATSEESLTIPAVPARFELETLVEIKPHENTALSGLYKSGGNFCTQCEAMGFRRITYFLDRPDVMARYTTTIEADGDRYPVLLSNGNRVEEEELGAGRRRVVWEDPFPKPSYLFALVAGDLRCHAGSFTTRSGREVRLEIWVEPQNIDSCEHALQSLQKAMAWDEEVFGLEYDLGIYMIVAVNDFNMGAMENKGLNIFNSKYVLARPETATDDDYEAVEGVIAHEYFHNWTGNRVTCRDWFQLTLKEGLTVFRDQQFSGDMTSAAVKRIQEVRALRTAQFAEDAGPMSHPIRPDSYISMDNFYTVTVYEKGAEVVRLYHTLLGTEGFRRGMDLYFQRHDGQAVTCDDFRAAMADANGRDLGQFEGWYSRRGTPVVEAAGEYDADSESYRVSFRQSVGTTGEDEAHHVPVALGLLGADGRDLPLRLKGEPPESGATTRVLELRGPDQAFTFTGLREPPGAMSLLRNFSAPVKLVTERSREQLAFLMAHDSDGFNRWDAGQELAKALLLELCEASSAGDDLWLDPLLSRGFASVLNNDALDGSVRSLMLGLPGEKLLGQEQEVVDVDGLHRARRFVIRALASEHRDSLAAVYRACSSDGPYRADREAIAQRRLKNCALGYLAALEEPELVALVTEQFRRADNMTDLQAALWLLVDIDCPEREEVLTSFHERWRHDPLVLDKWFSTQALSSLPDTLDHVLALSRHPDFTLANPNRARSLIGAFCSGNQVRFHRADGAGYRFLADAVLELDASNPQLASRLVSIFTPWRRFDEGRQAHLRTELERIAAPPKLSKDVFEIVERCLN